MGWLPFLYFRRNNPGPSAYRRLGPSGLAGRGKPGKAMAMTGFFIALLALSAPSAAAMPVAGASGTFGQLRKAVDVSGGDTEWASFTATPVGPVPGRRPSWLVVEGDGPDFVSAEKTLLSAMEILSRTPTGAGFAPLLAGEG